jgi:prepilin-type N-terminal cleavage/methylation domain-containing protein
VRLKKPGFTIIECLISLLLLVIIMIGGMAFYTYASQYTRAALHKRAALEIANTRMEAMRNSGYSSLPDPAPVSGLWQGPLNISVANIAGQENIYVYDVDENIDGVTDYKKVSVEIKWQQAGNTSWQTIKLETYIAP